jgi:hypothetical protein
MEICRDGGHYRGRLSEIMAVCAPAKLLPADCCVGDARACGFLPFPGASIDDLANVVAALAERSGSTTCLVLRVDSTFGGENVDWVGLLGEFPLVEFDPRVKTDFEAAWYRGNVDIGAYFLPDAIVFDPVGRWFIHFQFDFNCGVFAHPDPALGRAALAACSHDHALTVAEAEASGVVFPDGMRDGERHAFFRAMEATFGGRHAP